MDHLKHQKYKSKQLENNFKPVNISNIYMDEFEKKKRVNKEEKTFIKNTWCDWYNWLINYIPEPLKKP